MLSHTLVSIPLLVAASLSIATAAGPGRTPRQKTKTVFACRIDLLTPEERQSLSEIIPKLLSGPHTAKELPNGYEIRYPDGPAMFSTVLRWFDLESRCCQFFGLSASQEKNGGPLTVRITGDDGVKAFIKSDMPKLAELSGGKTH